MFAGDSTSLTSDLSEEQSESKTSEEIAADQDSKSKQSDETSSTSAEACVKAKDCDECHTKKIEITDKIQRLLENEDEEENKSFFRPLNYPVDKDAEVQVPNFNERLEMLPEHLRQLVLEDLKKLREQDRLK